MATAIQLREGQIKDIPLTLIMPDPNQPRKFFDEDYIDELAADIKPRGVREPITVIKIKDPKFQFMIVKGECRYRGSKKAKKKTIPCKLGDKQDNDPFTMYLDQVQENVRRKDLNAMEMAFFFKRLRDDFKIGVNQIPSKLKKYGFPDMSRSYVSNYIRLTELPKWNQDLICKGVIGAAHGKYIMPALHCEKVLAHVQSELTKKVNNKESIKVTDIKNMVFSGYQKTYPSLNAWPGTKNAPLYNVDRLDDEDLSALNIRKITNGYDQTSQFILNTEEHDRRQKIAKEEQKKAAKRNTPQKKQPEIKELAPYQLKEALFFWLKQQVMQALFESKLTAKTKAILDNLFLWSVAGRPWSIDFDEGEEMIWSEIEDDEMKATVRALKELKYQKLSDFLTGKHDNQKLGNELVKAAVKEMSNGSIEDLVNHLEINRRDYRITEGDGYSEAHNLQSFEAIIRTFKTPKVASWKNDDIRLRAETMSIEEFAVKYSEVIGLPKDMEAYITDCEKEEAAAKEEEAKEASAAKEKSVEQLVA